MAEEAKEKGKKGGSKLPVIAVCVLMLVMGGFFGLKMKGGGAKEKTDLKLGEIEPVKEFLVNLQTTGAPVYLRTELGLQFPEADYKKEEMFDKNLQVIQDAIIKVLSGKTVKDISTVEGKDHLKKEIAEKVNAALNDVLKKPFPKSTTHHDTWDNDSGPVLKVYFTSFAFQ
jgi:flagellar FliL protein